MKIPELLAPAGIWKAKIAIAYGADAIYLSGQLYGMRAGAGNFDNEQLAAVVKYAHDRGVKVYVTVNIIPHNQHLEGCPNISHSCINWGLMRLSWLTWESSI